MSAKVALFSSPASVSVDAIGRVYVADAANAKVKRIVPRVARYDSVSRQYSVVDADRNEVGAQCCMLLYLEIFDFLVVFVQSIWPAHFDTISGNRSSFI